MEILIIIVLVIGGWLFYKQVNKLNQEVAWLNKEMQEIQTKVREIDGMMKKLSLYVFLVLISFISITVAKPVLFLMNDEECEVSQ